MKKTKRLAMGILMLLTAFICMAAASATTSGPDVRVNGRLVDFPDEKPFIQDGRTYIPVRFVAEALGADVSWSHEIQGAVIKKAQTELQLPIGSNIMTVIQDGIASQVTMDVATMKQNGRTLIPIRFVAETLGAWVSFSTAYNTVQIYADALTPDEIEELHSRAHHWEICDERLALFDGKADYENLNECCMRDFVSPINYTIRNPYTGTTYSNGIDSMDEKTQLVIEYIRANIEDENEDISLGVSAEFRTDISCLSAHVHGTDPNYINRGYLTLTFDDNANIAAYKNKYPDRKLGRVYPGNSYTYEIEGIWMINLAAGRPQCMGLFDITDGKYVRWRGIMH